MSDIQTIIETGIPLLLVIPLLLILLPLRKTIHKFEDYVYLGGLGLVSLIIINEIYEVIPSQIFAVIETGGLSFAFFFLVMVTGAFKRKTKPYIMFMQIRREMALLGFILLIPHGLKRLDFALSGFNFTGLIAMVIMVPLVITSYPLIRKKMRFKTWQSVHKSAYIVYIMIYLHLGFTLILSNGFTIRFMTEALIIHLGFAFYLFLKIKNRIIPYIRKTYLK